jgi:hypothetical protein
MAIVRGDAPGGPGRETVAEETEAPSPNELTIEAVSTPSPNEPTAASDVRPSPVEPGAGHDVAISPNEPTKEIGEPNGSSKKQGVRTGIRTPRKTCPRRRIGRGASPVRG